MRFWIQTSQQRLRHKRQQEHRQQSFSRKKASILLLKPVMSRTPRGLWGRMHSPGMLPPLRPGAAGAKAVAESVVPNPVCDLPETEEVKPRRAEMTSLYFGVASGGYMQVRACPQDACGVKPAQELGAHENRNFRLLTWASESRAGTKTPLDRGLN